MSSKSDSVAGPNAGFAYHQDTFAQMVEDVLRRSRALGASDAAAEVSESCGLSVSVRMGELENVERNRDKSLGVAVHLGQRRGHASTSDFSSQALQRTVQAAFDIARFTAEDPAAALPEAQDLATSAEARRDLDLFHPWDISAEQARDLAMSCEQAALSTSKKITNSDGAAVSAQQSHFFAANTRGFAGGYSTSRHSVSVAPIAGRGSGMQRDYWYSSQRNARDLAPAPTVGRYAAERALSRLNARKLPTCEVPVLFEAPLASGLLGSLVQALSGGALYRRASFLLDSLGKRVLPAHIDLYEDPFIVGARASAPFDDEGVRVQARQVVAAGQIQGYFLSSYSARKLGMRTTGNAGGAHNLRWRSRRTRPGDDLPAMLRKLHRGLFVTELMGQGVNGVTGDYSRGASGFWVEGGEIAYPVQEITIAGNLLQMFKQLEAIGADEYDAGGRQTGSVLVARMKVAGS